MPHQPSLNYERSRWQQGDVWVAGVDEVGLGCLAGPIVVAAVVLPSTIVPLAGVCDSKKMSAHQRKQAFDLIYAQAARIGLGIATVAEIDRINVLQASYLAMNRALARVQPVHHALIDGRAIKPGKITGEYTTIVKGDVQSYAIACASVIAKVRRDRLMQRLAQKYPGYGWEKNAGYGTAQHRAALSTLGITPWHRQSYAPVAQVMAQLSLF